MSEIIGFSPSQEYDTLREEFLQSKKYVFERPLLIIAVGLTGINIMKDDYISILPFLPLLLAFLLLFNFWFTANRLKSSARIAAYIQLELEEKKYSPWIGWETCLRYYRKWSKKKSEIEIDKDAVPDSMMFYPMIFYFHVIVMLMLLSTSVYILCCHFNEMNLILSCITIVLYIWFFCACIKYRPPTMRIQIEKYRVIWELVFQYMQKEGLKNRNDSINESRGAGLEF